MLSRIIRYIQRMRAIRRWAKEHDDPITYHLANDEVNWWKQRI